MAEIILPPILQGLASLIADEGRFLSAVARNVDWLRDELASMQSFLQDAETSDGEDRLSTMWVDQIRDMVSDAEDIIDIFDATRVRSCACFILHFKSRHAIGSRIKDIRATLGDISRRRSEYILPQGGNSNSDELRNRWIRGLLASSPLIHDGDTVGMEKDLELLVGWVLAGGAGLGVISLVGMGGVGKTTLIKKVYNRRDVRRHFDRSAWIYVSQSVQLRDLFSEMAKGLMGIPSTEASSLSEQQLQEILSSSLEELKFLVVLDDVWNESLWDAMKLVLPRNSHGSRVIITTRNNGVASSIIDAKSCIHWLHPLSLEESWALFCKKAFAEGAPCPEELKEVAQGIVRKCDGLPLAVVTVGGMMSRKEKSLPEWRHVLDHIYKDFRHDNTGVQRALLLSYNDMTYALKSCFLLCSVFPYDTDIPRKKLIRLWAAEGFIKEDRGERMEDVAEKYLMELVGRNMIQVSIMSSSGRVKVCRIHDLLHQLAISISEKEKFSAVCDDQKKEIPNATRRVSFQRYFTPVRKEGKPKFRSFFVLGMSEPFNISQKMSRSLRLLRVLDLEDSCLRKLPSEVGDLIHLRYLGLRGTKLKELPRSVRNLHNLQTLDIRRTQLIKLSFEIQCLKQLRHLEMRQVERSIRVPLGIGYLEGLQVVTGIQANKVLVHEIRKLTQLRKLVIEELQAADSAHLCSSIDNMPGLLSLSIFAEDAEKPIDFTSLNPSSSLQKLHIAGCLERLPMWFGGIRNLTKLRLVLSRLNEDPFPVLKELPNLVFLQLYEAYQGKTMRCSKPGFNKLKVLVLTGLEKLEEWEVERGTMPCIQELWIMSCSSLKMIPLGFEFLSTVQKLRLVNMPEDFIRRLSPSMGEDFSRVQHIPSIQVLH